MSMRTVTKNISLTEDLAKWADSKIGVGYTNVSEVVREALRFKKQAEESDYVNPPPLKPGTLARIYAEELDLEKDHEIRLAGRSTKRLEAE